MEIKFDLLITGGQVVCGNSICLTDIGIRDGKIVALSPAISVEESKQTIHAAGKTILPGIIDVNVHPLKPDDFESCSQAAAFGGTTTLLYYICAQKGETLEGKIVQTLEEASKNSLLDFGFHGGILDALHQAPEIPTVIDLGVKSFLLSLAQREQSQCVGDYQLMKAMDILAEHDGMALVHAENGGGVSFLEDKYLKGPLASAKYFNISRPAALEEEAIFRSICLAEITHCPLYIPHVTSARALRPIRQALEEGILLFAETCPQYLNLTQDNLEEHGALAKLNPPLRTAEDQKALWRALQDGSLQVVASHHYPARKSSQKSFLDQPPGSPQVETLFPLMHHSGVNNGRISLVRLVQILCENPARIFGLYPTKGVIAIGSDADLVIFNTSREMVIRSENQHSNMGYTLYEDTSVLGWPERSFQRGKPVLIHGEIVSSPGDGKFLNTNPAKMEMAIV